MLGSIFFLSFFEPYDYDPEYENLSDEERMYLDYTKKCLFYEEEVIMEACSKMQMLLLEASSKLNTEEEITEQELISRMNEIYSGLSIEEKEKVESFVYACIQCMGIYSEEAKKQRRLKKKGND